MLLKIPCRHVAIGLLCILLTACKPKSTDTLFYNGQILTLNADNARATALLIHHETVVAAGTEAQMAQLSGPDVRQIDLQGKTLMPAFIAAHEHPAIEAVFADFIDLSGFTHAHADEVWAALKRATQTTPKGQWIYGLGLDPLLIPQLNLPDKTFLDALAPEHPVFLVSQSLHSFWANSRAMAKVGVDAQTPDPGHGSFYGRTPTGELTGFMTEKAADPFMAPLKSPLTVLANYRAVLQKFKRRGYTSVASLGFNLPPLAAKYAGRYWTQPIIRQFFYLKEDEWQHLPEQPDRQDTWFRILGPKLWLDGSPYSGTMFLQQPYLANAVTAELGIAPGHTGSPTLDIHALAHNLNQFSRQGWQMAIHSQGDAANHWIIDQLKNKPEYAQNRHRLEHCLLLPAERLADAKHAGLSPSFHINHLLYYGDALQDSLLGHDRSQQLLPVASAEKMGLHPSLHADSPMFEADPFLLMQTAILRTSRTGRVLNAKEALTPEQALRTLTINPAWQLHMDTQLGSLEAGKLADFIVLSHNPLTLPAEQWHSINVEQVWLAGQRDL